ncbi:MAG: hypothetical protein QM734_03165 [Cyclobacteriaceae bacterium]
MMKIAAENYKGIKYVRISALPSEQKNHIWKTINHNLIIKILMGDSLLNDCIQYQHYQAWYENSFLVYNQQKSVEMDLPVVGNLAIAS